MSGDNGRRGFEHGTGFLLARLGSLTARSWAAFLAGHELTPSQYVVLVTINEQGAVGQRHLAELLAMDARNIVPVLDSLTTRGLVERRTNHADRRRRIVTLTDAGNALVDVIASTAATKQDEFLRALTHSDREDLNRLLRQLYDSHLQIHITDLA